MTHPSLVQLDRRDNALNLFRLILATLVLLSHSYFLAHVGTGPRIEGHDLGTWAVYGFFAISGYLITASRLSNSFVDYLRKRIVRIYPGFFACLVIVAFIFAPIGYRARQGSLAGFWTSPHGPFEYVFANATLKMVFYDVSGTPSAVPQPGAWNGSLWSLFFEFLCYLIIGAATFLPFFRCLSGLSFGYCLSLVVWVAMPQLPPIASNNYVIYQLAELAPWFFGGAATYALTRHRSATGRGAILAVALAITLMLLSPTWGPQAAAVPVTYLLMWLASILPSPSVIRRHDISYGMYIYAFPIQQLLAVAGLTRWGIPVYAILALLLTFPCALASWLLVERRAMRRFGAATAPRRQAATASP